MSTAFIGAVSVLAGMLVDFYPLLIAGKLLWLVAAALGALALFARRGTKASKVLLRSFAAIGLGLVAAVITAYLISLSMSV